MHDLTKEILSRTLQERDPDLDALKPKDEYILAASGVSLAVGALGTCNDFLARFTPEPDGEPAEVINLFGQDEESST